MSKKKNKPIIWSNNHRVVYAHAYSAKIGADHASIEFGTEQPLGENGAPAILSDVQIMMNLRGMKILSLILQELVERYEDKMGVIEVPEGKAQEIKDALQEVEAEAKAKKSN